MDPELHFIPPCCINKNLPKAIKQASHHIYSFYTHGGITAENFYRAVSYLVPDSHVMVLNIPVLKEPLVAFLHQCLDRGWCSDIILSTTEDATALLRHYLLPYQSHVLYTHSKAVTQHTAHMVLYNDRSSLTISGPMLNNASQNINLASYTTFWHPDYNDFSKIDCGSHLQNILLPDIMRFRLTFHKVEKSFSSEINRFLNYNLPPFRDEE